MPAADGDDYGTVRGSGDYTYGSGSYHWSLDRGGVLTITGAGELTHLPTMDVLYDAIGDISPSDITEIYIGSGITSVKNVDFSFSSGGTLRIGGTVTLFDPQNSYGGNAETVVFEEGVTGIGVNAFWQNASLKRVVLPKSLTSIGKNAFHQCTNLESVVFSEGLETIESSAFSNCTSLKSVVLPASVITIGSDAFTGCSAMQSAEINGCREMGDYAFRNCIFLETVVFGENAEIVGTKAFEGCKKIETVDMSGSIIAKINTSAFTECISLENLSFSPALREIAAGAFDKCVLLTELTFPEGIERIAGFNNCTGLTSVSFPEGVLSVGYFKGCTSLTSLRIPGSVESIFSFADCTGLRTVVIEDGAEKTMNASFSGCVSLESADCGASVTKMIGGVFSGCTALTDVKLSPALTSIGEKAFKDCASLEALTLPDSVTELGKSVFEGCAALRTITLGAGITGYDCVIRSGISYGIRDLRADAVTNIYVSETNEALMSIDGVVYTKDGKTLFWYPNGRADENYMIPDGVKSIGLYAFYNGSNTDPALRTLYIPASVRTIEMQSAPSLEGLTDVWYAGTEEAYGSIRTSAGSSHYLTNPGGVAFHFNEAFPGDADGSGRTEAADAAKILRSEENELDPSSADVSSDGRCNAYDAALILQYKVGLITAFPKAGSIA